MRIFLLLPLAFACQSPSKLPLGGKDTASNSAFDEDGDGYATDQDCNDEDPATYPGGLEVCDGIDNNCDGVADEGVQDTVFPDADGDGFGDPALGELACGPGDGFVTNDNDCDDANPDAWPGAPELCDAVDNDCDGDVDDGAGFYAFADADGDGFGDAAAGRWACEGEPGVSADNTDCDDGDAAVFPGAGEVCNAVDDDCDGTVDEGVTQTYFADVDGDTWGDGAAPVEACARPDGTAERAGDCDDSDFDFFPGAPETDCADPNDYNCDGSVAYADADADGFAACRECDDGDAAVFPGAGEVCNGLDDDCDGLTDDGDPGVDLGTAGEWYTDADGDGFGDAESSTIACDAPVGTVADDTDCDDLVDTTFPGADEVCNGADDDCDTLVDGADGDVDLSTGGVFYPDSDGDGFGVPGGALSACTRPSGYAVLATDCDDGNGSVFPGAFEVCNSIDDDCDALVDDADSGRTGGTVFYRDADGDGYGVVGTTVTACVAPAGYVALPGDCNDGAATVRPFATEACNAVDDDCDGSTDEGVLGTGASCAAIDCTAIKADNPSRGDGTYTLTRGSYVCDMTRAGGGWTRVGDNHPVYGTGWNGTSYNTEGFTWDEVLFVYDSGSTHGHCTFPSDMPGCNPLGFSFSGATWAVAANWGSSVCGMPLDTSTTASTTYVGSRDFIIARGTTTQAVRLGHLEGISACTTGDNYGTAYVDIYVRR